MGEDPTVVVVPGNGDEITPEQLADAVATTASAVGDAVADAVERITDAVADAAPDPVVPPARTEDPAPWRSDIAALEDRLSGRFEELADSIVQRTTENLEPTEPVTDASESEMSIVEPDVTDSQLAEAEHQNQAWWKKLL